MKNKLSMAIGGCLVMALCSITQAEPTIEALRQEAAGAFNAIPDVSQFKNIRPTQAAVIQGAPVRVALNRKSEYWWRTNGECGEFVGDTIIREGVDLQYCRHFNGSHYSWSEGGQCAEYTPSGRFVQRAADNIFCQYAKGQDGSGYFWMSSGECGKFTPDGDTLIRSGVDRQYCRYFRGSHYSWSQGGQCVEYTPSKHFVGAAIDDIFCGS